MEITIAKLLNKLPNITRPCRQRGVAADEIDLMVAAVDRSG
jgi:hypothetical protein